MTFLKRFLQLWITCSVFKVLIIWPKEPGAFLTFDFWRTAFFTTSALFALAGALGLLMRDRERRLPDLSGR